MENGDCEKAPPVPPPKKRKSVVSFATEVLTHGDEPTATDTFVNARPGVYFNRGVSDSIWTTKKKERTIRSGSVYVKSRRFSRYGNLGNFFKPYLTTTKPKKDEIPIDSIGLFNNLSFWWINKYTINEKKLKALAMAKILPSTNEDDEESSCVRALQIPAPTAKDRTALNQKRLLVKYGNEENVEENVNRSMFRVLWSFSKTRYLITFFPHLVLMATMLVFPLLLKFTSDSIYNEYVKLNHSKHYETLSDEDFMLTQKMFLHTLGENARPDIHNRSAEGINLLGSYIQTLNYFTEHHRNQTWNPELQNRPELTLKYLQHVYKKQEQQILNAKARHTYVAIMVIMFVLFILSRSLINFLNLRTAIRFRSGCVGAVYKKAMRSLVTYRISPSQILAMAMDDSDILMSLSTKGLSSPFTLLKLIIVTIFYSAAIYHVNLTLGIGYAYVVLFPVIALLVSRIGSFYLKKVNKYRSMKIALMEEFVVNFKTIIMFHYQRTVIERFMELCRKEFSYLRRMLNWSVKFIPEFISILLFSFVALENPDKLNPNANLILLIYILTVQWLMRDLFEGIDSWIKSQPTLAKLKSVYQLKTVNISKSQPSATTVLSIRDGRFNWYRYMNDSWKHNKMDVLVTQKTAQLTIKEFSLLKNQIVGVCGASGSGKTMLMYSILGHTCWSGSGEVQQKGSFTFFPSTGYFNVDTLVENLLMNASYNRDCVDDALSIVGLDELFGDNSCLGEQLGNLELTPDQLDKLILAQAIYCESDLILLDNPLSRCDSNDRVETLAIFQNVIDNLVVQKKSVIIATQNQDFLKYCHHIYFLQNGMIAFEGAYKDLKRDEAFKASLIEGQVVQHYNNKVDFCGISPTEMYPEIRGDDCEYKPNRSHFLGLLLAIFIATSSVAYFTLPLVRVFKSLAANDSMLGLFIIVSVVGKLLTVIIITMFTGTGRAKAIVMDKIKLKKLLGTSVNYFYISSLAETIHKFAENNFFDTMHVANLIENFFGILISLTLSSIMCPWLSIIYAVILIKLVFVCKFYKKTSHYLHTKIHQSTMLLHKTVTNHIRGRVALQSMPNFDKYLKNCYEIIDANSTAIFMYKAMVYHVQFLVQIFFVIGFLTLCFTILLEDPTKQLQTQANFVYGIFLFFCFCDHANRLVANTFEIRGDIVREQNHQKWLFNITQRQRSDQIVTDLKPEESISLDIQDLVVKMGHQVNLRIGKFNIQSGEIVRIQGVGTQFIVPLLNRILTPKSGVIFFGGTDLWAFSEAAYEKLIGFVPLNIQANSKTIRAILDYKNEYPNDFLIDVLGEFKLLPSLTNAKLVEPISVLAHWEKQVLCLARIVITKPKVIVIENPHPKALPIIESTLEQKFPNTTVLFIGSNDYKLCGRTVQLE